ncbi:Flp family type IVb pilin [Microvirga sp. BSC39]|jgi:pilus assembly protein Flp/PilA|uniref:Flp family type IVb pilin n=1 Tax=Microvirga sp. BSC39 TaxID=1549810 RepID=UPI0009DFCD02|nr:Flp family type IVb pilin [Microvirga sp. BSC39]
MKSLFTRFAKDESGATAIEYGLIAAGLAVVIIGVFKTDGKMGTTLTGLFDKVADAAK